jgi:hypothetical protein
MTHHKTLITPGYILATFCSWRATANMVDCTEHDKRNENNHGCNHNLPPQLPARHHGSRCGIRYKQPEADKARGNHSRYNKHGDNQQQHIDFAKRLHG